MKKVNRKKCDKCFRFLPKKEVKTFFNTSFSYGTEGRNYNICEDCMKKEDQEMENDLTGTTK